MSSRFLAALCVCGVESQIYVTNCGLDDGCGKDNGICGGLGDSCPADEWDSASFNEGSFGTNCWCEDGIEENAECTIPGWVTGYGDLDVHYCNGRGWPQCSPDNCETPVCVGAGDYIDPSWEDPDSMCTFENGCYTQTTIHGACPVNHPNNVEKCCNAVNSGQNIAEECSCIFMWSVDLSPKPYKELGSSFKDDCGDHNGYAEGAWVGWCGSPVFSLKIDVNSDRGRHLGKSFKSEWCAENNTLRGTRTNHADCGARSEADCSGGCIWCHASGNVHKTYTMFTGATQQCFEKREAHLLSHIFKEELGSGHFACASDLAI